VDRMFVFFSFCASTTWIFNEAGEIFVVRKTWTSIGKMSPSLLESKLTFVSFKEREKKNVFNSQRLWSFFKLFYVRRREVKLRKHSTSVESQSSTQSSRFKRRKPNFRHHESFCFICFSFMCTFEWVLCTFHYLIISFKLHWFPLWIREI
jgi:hypothetical protein